MQKFLTIILFFSCLIISQIAQAQGSAGSNSNIEPRYLIDLPTAGMIPHSTASLDLDFYQANGLLATVSVGAFDRLLIGLSYGGTDFIGSEKPKWNDYPGLNIKIRLLEESIALPAIAIGFDSQGKEFYLDPLNRYSIKSLGFYAVGSKNFEAMGFLSFHGGVNYSLERSDGDSDPNFFFGVEKTVGPFISCLAEYNLGINDSNHEAIGRGRGYLNVGIRASIGNGFTLGFNLKDIFQNQQNITIGNRTLKLEYVATI
jgi:hypothetical protein